MPPPPPLRALYIEDSSVDADLARRALAKHAPHISLTIAHTLEEGWSVLAGEGGFDVVLVDLNLPDGSGLSVLTRAREADLPVAVVILTGSGDQDAAIAALKAGADDYLVKRDDYLTRLPGVLAAAVTRQRDARRRRHRGLKVLYVEHNTFDVDLLQRHLTHHAPHIQITAISEAAAALALLPLDASVPSPFDVLLVDYRLPGMDGLELAKILREERGLDLPIVLITGQGSEEVAARALHMGIDDYLAKHEGYLFEVAAVLEKVQRQAELRREREALRTTSQRLRFLIESSPTILYTLEDINEAPRIAWISENINHLVGLPQPRLLASQGWLEQIHPEDREAYRAWLTALREKHEATHEYRILTSDRQLRWVRDTVRILRDEEGSPKEGIGTWMDITARHREEAVREARNALLDQVLTQRPLEAIFTTLAQSFEALLPGAIASILRLNPQDGRLYTAVAPRLPAFFTAAVNGLMPGPGQGSCGVAAWRGKPAIASDLAHHPDWAEYRDLAARAGLAACWSQPYLDETGHVLGTFAIYHTQPLAPTEADLRLMEEFARLTALAETKVRDRERLRQAAEAIAATRDGVVITDLIPRIVAINPAYTEITGYTEAEALGQNPSLVKSGRHDQAFYQALWHELQATGHWQGEIWNRRKSGEIYPQWLSISTVRNERGEPTHYVGVFTDISHIKDAEARLEHLAHHDPLTDLPNRLLVLSRLNAAIDRALRQHRQLAVLYIDLDDFKTINDSLGHPAGDQVLIVIAQRLRTRLREQDTVARLGGDEFLVLLEDIDSVEDAARVAQALIDLCASPITLENGQEVFVGLSIGISLCPDNAEETTTLIQYADAAMYQAKREGRNTYRFHTAALTEAAAQRLRLETRLRHALDRHELVLHYQPLIDARDGRPMGVEALLRWQPPGEPLVPPGRFIPIAEASGLIVRMGAWALREACLQAQRWREAGLAIDTLAVNLSARQFQSGDLVGLVQTSLAESGLPPHCLELELTESILMEHEEDFLGCLDRLKALGVRLAIDDFGTGYSSLAYLKRFPIDKLKIDQSFVRGLVESDDDREIAATIVAMGRNLHLEVLAEGVETDAQRDILVKLGCNAFQGFLFSRPLPAEALEAWWRERVR